MISMLIKAAIIIVVLVIVGFVIVWALAQVGVVIPQIVIMGVVAVLVLIGLLWLWENRANLFKF